MTGYSVRDIKESSMRDIKESPMRDIKESPMRDIKKYKCGILRRGAE
ncbi:MAG: hypothetical protein FWG03_04615 [Clostridiales bacterium]|nr:hypothetical protein [Clostridiales bacterium]